MKKQQVKSNKQYRRVAAAAACMIIGVGAVGGIQTFATVNPVVHNIAQTLGLTGNLQDYISVVNQPVTKDGTTVQITEVAYDRENHKMILATTLASVDGVEEGTKWSPHTQLYVNGQELNVTSYSTCTRIDENTMGFVQEFFLDQEFKGNMDVKVAVVGAEVNDVYEKKTWEFKFTTNGENLAKDTYEVAIQEAIDLENDAKIQVAKFTSNVFGKSIYYTISKGMFAHDIMIKGEDNLGNEVVFDFKYGETLKGGELKLNEEKSHLADDATSMTLQVYQLDTDNEYSAVGETFTVALGR